MIDGKIFNFRRRAFFMVFQGSKFEQIKQTRMRNSRKKFQFFSLQIRTKLKRWERNERSFIFQRFHLFQKRHLFVSFGDHSVSNSSPFFFEPRQITLILGAQEIEKTIQELIEKMK